jgi:hypothetical protein
VKETSKILFSAILAMMTFGMASCQFLQIDSVGPEGKSVPGKFMGLSFKIGAEWEKHEMSDPQDNVLVQFDYKGDMGKCITLEVEKRDVGPNRTEDFYDDEWKMLKRRALTYGYKESDVTMEDWTNGYVTGKSYITPSPSGDTERDTERWIVFNGGGTDNMVFAIIYNWAGEYADAQMNKSVEKFIDSVKPDADKVTTGTVHGKFMGLSFAIAAEWEKRELTNPHNGTTLLAFYYKGNVSKYVLLGVEERSVAPERMEALYYNKLEQLDLEHENGQNKQVTMEDWTNGYVTGKSYITPYMEYVDSERWIVFGDGGKNNTVFSVMYMWQGKDTDVELQDSIEAFINSIKPESVQSWN